MFEGDSGIFFGPLTGDDVSRMPDALVAGWLKCHRRPLLRFAGLDRAAPPAVRRPSAA